MKIRFRRIISVILVCSICFTFSAIYSDAAKVVNSNTMEADPVEVWEWTLITDYDSLKSYTTGTEIMKKNPVSGQTVGEYYKKYLSDYKLLVIYGFTEYDFKDSVVPAGYGTDGGVEMEKDCGTLCYFNATVDDTASKPALSYQGLNVDGFLGNMVPGILSFKTLGGATDDIPNVVFTDSNNIYLWTESTSGNPIGIYDLGYSATGNILSPNEYKNTNLWHLVKNVNGTFYGGNLSYGSGAVTYFDCPSGPYSYYASVNCYTMLNSTENGRCMFYVGKKVGEQSSEIVGDKIIPSGNTVTIAKDSIINSNATVKVEPGAKLVIDASVELNGTINNYGTVVINSGASLNLSLGSHFLNYGKSTYNCNDGQVRNREGNLIIARNGTFSTEASSPTQSGELSSYGGRISCAGTINDGTFQLPCFFINQTEVYFAYGSSFVAENRCKYNPVPQSVFKTQFSSSSSFTLINENFLIDS